jgi:transcriptional regulator with XRE-family HTH domain
LEARLMDEFSAHFQSMLGRRIRRRRRHLDLSQEALAERADIHRTQVSLFENGERMPLAVTLVKLAAALSVSVDQLIEGIEWKVVAGPPLRDPGEGSPHGW